MESSLHRGGTTFRNSNDVLNTIIKRITYKSDITQSQWHRLTDPITSAHRVRGDVVWTVCIPARVYSKGPLLSDSSLAILISFLMILLLIELRQKLPKGCIFPMVSEHSSLCLLAICILSSENLLFISPLVDWVASFLFRFLSSSHILRINTLSDVR